MSSDCWFAPSASRTGPSALVKSCELGELLTSCSRPWRPDLATLLWDCQALPVPEKTIDQEQKPVLLVNHPFARVTPAIFVIFVVFTAPFLW